MTRSTALAAALFALLVIHPASAAAQIGPSPTSGNIVTSRPADDATPATAAGGLRSFAGNLPALRQWLAGMTWNASAPAPRIMRGAKPAVPARNRIWLP